MDFSGYDINMPKASVMNRFDETCQGTVPVALKIISMATDFEDAVSGALKEDFIYFDSPYAPVSETADFTQYAKTGFSLVDHQRLSSLYRSLTERKVRCMLSNNDVSLIRELYAGYSIEPLNVSRSINRNGSLRKGKEVLITNYIV